MSSSLTYLFNGLFAPLVFNFLRYCYVLAVDCLSCEYLAKTSHSCALFTPVIVSVAVQSFLVGYTPLSDFFLLFLELLE